MLIALTGTPGTGKTSVSRIIEERFKVIHLNDIKEARIDYDEKRESYIVNIEYLKDYVKNLAGEGKTILESHYSHELPVDIVIVLRCHPDELRKRLEKRGYSQKKIRENMEAEAMGLITGEALILHSKDKVFEVDTTERVPQQVARDVLRVIKFRDSRFRPRINYMEEILKWY